MAAALAIVLVAIGSAFIGGPPVESEAPSVDASTSASVSDPSLAPTPSQSSLGETPAELLDKAWLGFDGTGWQVGTLGDGPKAMLPVDEYGLAADAGFVLSIDSETGSTVFVREMDSGNLVHQMQTELRIDVAVLRGDRFFLTGVINDGDAGVWVGRIGEVQLVQLIPGSEGPLLGDRGGFRAGIKLSPTGQTLASTVCVTPACVTQVVSTGGGAVLTIADSIARWDSEDHVVITDGSHVRAYGLDDGKLRWQLDGLNFWDGYLTSDGRSFIAQAITENGDNEIWRVDTQTGGHEVIAPLAADQYLFSTLSSDRYAVVLAASSIEDALASGATFDVLDLTSGVSVTSQPFPRSPR